MESKEEIVNLINEFKNGNKDSFVQIINKVQEYVYKTIYSFIGNEENSIEVFDNVIFKSYTNLHKLNHPEFFKTWIIRIAINESKNFLSKNSKVVHIDEYNMENESFNTHNHFNIDNKIDFERALNKLNIDFKSILIMKFYMDFTFEEIANTMEKPTSTIKTWYYKALSNLKENLSISTGEVKKL